VNALDVTDKPRLRPLRWRWDGEEGQHIAVAVPNPGGIYFLNPSAAKIFAACDGTKTVAELAGILVEAYEIGLEQAVKDTLKVLDLWREMDMLQ